MNPTLLSHSHTAASKPGRDMPKASWDNGKVTKLRQTPCSTPITALAETGSQGLLGRVPPALQAALLHVWTQLWAEAAS